MNLRAQSGTSRLMRLAVVASALLVVMGAIAFWYASGVAHKVPKVQGHSVTVTIVRNRCEPNDITVPAGRTTFTIVNKSERALEWEILDGVMVVEERENIAPGFSQIMTAKLSPGEFDITCGLLSNPRGKLRVTPSADSDAEAARPSLVNYLGALSEYRVYLVMEVQALQDVVAQLDVAIQANDLAAAKDAYVLAHQSYKRIEPMAELFADLDTRLNARADYFEKREADLAFTGFHRIEHALYAQREMAPAKAASTTLVADVAMLVERIGALSVPPERLAASASRLLRRIADNLPAAGEDQDASAELANLQGSLEGTRRIHELLSPLLAKSNPALNTGLDARFADFDAALVPHREEKGEETAFRTSSLSAEQRAALATPIRALADDLGKVNAALGLE